MYDSRMLLLHTLGSDTADHAHHGIIFGIGLVAGIGMLVLGLARR
jgi:hypothetical protein